VQAGPSHLDNVRRQTEGVSLDVLSLPSRPGAAVLALAFLLSMSAGVLVAPQALAQPTAKVERMSQELRNNEDFRVRTQAALALGASKDKRAVLPLCDGLEDASATVRAAAGAALGKLALGGSDCLKTRFETETNASVKSVLAKALDAVKAGQRPVVTLETKYYVAVGSTTDKTGRAGTSIDDMVHGAAAEAVADMEGFVVAPRTETVLEAKAVTTKWKKLKAFFLWPKVQAPDYSGGNLTIRVEIAVFTYPGKAMKGTIPLKLTMSDVQPNDKESEDELIRRAVGSALAKFADNAERFAQ
jgi:hypothetical protein